MEPSNDTVGPDAWLTVPEAAERLDVRVTKVHQMVKSNTLLAVRRDGVWKLPADLVPDLRSAAGTKSNLARHLGGVLMLLHDAGYSAEDSVRWLYTPDPTLPEGTAAAALRERPTEIKRRAQALGF
ncbi:Rv2175c family DNA-binding protein [Cryptosporangium aurantiacum]|uniref:DNA binding domain-containing protein, excisionase family n=1 Tax=Cryptosporangium aurantiacum TaxID=134849 RepID=A0A1M7IJX4_9ACTN|nr:Rv2175c family DNA-binding protein [Cryptosporangium aurantiacum]SHM41084.1 DNA binding domain-containing protein, excisionase family [Cryptosporangium aurantiacum]